MNIPARYCTGYLGDIGVPPDPAPMDFSAWYEVFLGGMWYDDAEKKLYAPMHIEHDGIRRTYPFSRKIALATSTDRRTALAHFVLQMSPHDAALLQQALDQAHLGLGEGGTR